MFYAITVVAGQLAGYRSLAGAGDPLIPGEQLWQDTMPESPVWDAALNAGQGNIRPMSAAEQQEQLSAQMSQVQQHNTDTLALQAFYSKIQDGAQASTEDLADVLCAFIRIADLAPTAATAVNPSGSPILS